MCGGEAVLLHGDLHGANVLIDEGKVSGIIDFGDSLSGPPEYDLALLYNHLESKEAWSCFVEGYGKDFNEKKMQLYIFMFGTWLVSIDSIKPGGTRLDNYLQCLHNLS
eukprot:TRINITY_DN13848_c0_g1_i4.p3 TRINITY_DN13848_c0_g1~~TRINITY_DN13848_c0_g1_i4.p3  ORF type:complete len:108 (-),score=12.88 TRINITY_DN13848_c0_g1_i4:155-478(-)